MRPVAATWPATTQPANASGTAVASFWAWLLGMAAGAIQADPDHDESLAAERIAELVAAGGGSFNTRDRCRDHSVLNVSISSKVMVLEGRTVLINLVHNRTRLHQQEYQLQEQLALLNAGELLSGIGSWDLRFSDGRMRWSAKLRRLCRCNDDSQATSLWDYDTLVHPDDRSGWRQDLQRAVTRGEPLYSQHRLCFNDGSELIVQAMGTLREVHDQQERQRLQINSRCRVRSQACPTSPQSWMN